MAYQHLHVATADGVTTITINRPQALNVLTAVTMQELEQAFLAAHHDPAVRVVITQRLPRQVGRKHAMALILTGEMIDAQEAYRIGLVNKVVPLKDLMAEAVKLARLLASKSPTALQLCLEAVNRGCEMALDEGLEYEATLFAMAVASGDAQEGTQAFLEKRTPVWARARQ